MQQKNVLQFVNSPEPNQPPVPTYDLSGERICIALFIQRDGKKLDFYCNLKPPTAERTIRLLQDRNTYMVPSGDKDGGIDEPFLNSGSTDIDRAFFNEHQIAVSYFKQELTPEQLDKLDRLNNVRANAIARGLLMVGNPRALDPAEDPEIPTLEELLEESPRVRQFVLLADDEGVEHKLDIVHHFEPPTAKQTTEFQRIVKVRTIPGGARKFIARYKEFGKLYDAMIQRVDGVIGDRSAILNSLPFTWKMSAVQTLFQDAQRKNV